MVRAVRECLPVVLWNGTAGVAPLGHDLPPEFAIVALTVMAPSRVVAVWQESDTNPLLHSFGDVATTAYRR